MSEIWYIYAQTIGKIIAKKLSIQVNIHITSHCCFSVAPFEKIDLSVVKDSATHNIEKK